MKVFRFWVEIIALAAAFSVFVPGAFAQSGTSSASVARSRAIARETSFTLPDGIAVEEFVNYHKHRLPLPKAGQAVALDTRWGNDKYSPQSAPAILQIGFTTAEVSERTDLRPLNLALVIDKSGSMDGDNKMSRVKESLQTMIGKLNEDDIVSIITFDTEARTLVSATRVGNGIELRNAIASIEPGGSTNLNGGLMLGYREAQKNYQKDATNRVILLTDGIANVGETDPKRIAVASSEFNGQGIDLSTIGVGIDLDKDLLKTLANSGRGLFHFVADSKDIEKVFSTELQSLISPVARRAELSVDYDAGLTLEKVFGYAPKARQNGVTIPIDDMNSGLTQVVMMEFKLKNNGAAKNSYPVKIRLSYFDIEKKKMVEETQDAVLTVTANKAKNNLKDLEVKKNYTIAQLAQSMYDMSEAAKAKKYADAERVVNTSVSTARERFPNMEDKDIQYVLGIVENYQRELKTYNQRGKVAIE